MPTFPPVHLPAGACAKHSPLPVTFFARKGADCLGKFHGEAERTLRLLFEEVRWQQLLGSFWASSRQLPGSYECVCLLLPLCLCGVPHSN